MNTYLSHSLIALLAITTTILIWYEARSWSSQVVHLTNDQSVLTNTIAVQWDGEVRVTPDTFVVRVSVSELAPTTALAQESANQKMSQFMKALDELWVDDSDRKTQNMSLYPEYDYRDSGRKILWYRAQQSLEISLGGDDFVLQGEKVVDAVTQIAWVILNNTSFELRDREAVMAQARDLAYQKAEKKADQLARLAWSSVIDVLSLSDAHISFTPSPLMRNAMVADMAITESAWSQISAGEQVVTVTIDAVFVME